MDFLQYIILSPCYRSINSIESLCLWLVKQLVVEERRNEAARSYWHDCCVNAVSCPCPPLPSYTLSLSFSSGPNTCLRPTCRHSRRLLETRRPLPVRVVGQEPDPRWTPRCSRKNERWSGEKDERERRERGEIHCHRVFIELTGLQHCLHYYPQPNIWPRKLAAAPPRSRYSPPPRQSLLQRHHPRTEPARQSGLTTPPKTHPSSYRDMAKAFGPPSS